MENKNTNFPTFNWSKAFFFFFWKCNEFFSSLERLYSELMPETQAKRFKIIETFFFFFKCIIIFGSFLQFSTHEIS